VQRAIFHFISQTLLRVQRYRIYLVLYGGVGLSVVVASILRLTVENGQLHMGVSVDGVRATTGIVAFWMIAGLRMAFVSPGNRQGSWVFRIVHGRPPVVETALGESRAAQLWVLLWALAAIGALCAAVRIFAPPELLTAGATASLALSGGGLCLLLTDAVFLDVKIIPFSGDTAREEPNLALTVLKYFTFFPLIAWLPVVSEPWMEARAWHFALAAAAIAVAHMALRRVNRDVLQEHCTMPGLEDGEDDFPMKLGLRY
jgi:hypothetical protein